MYRPTATYSNHDIIEIPVAPQGANAIYDDIVEIHQTDPLALDITVANISGDSIEYANTDASKTRGRSTNKTSPRNRPIAPIPSVDSHITTSVQMLNMPTFSTITSVPASVRDISFSNREGPLNTENPNSKRLKTTDVNISKSISMTHPIHPASPNAILNQSQTTLYKRIGSPLVMNLDVRNTIITPLVAGQAPVIENSRNFHSSFENYIKNTTTNGAYVHPLIGRPQVPRSKSKSPGLDNPALPVAIQQHPISPTKNQCPVVHPLFTRKPSLNISQGTRNKSKSPEREIAPMAAARVSNNSILQPSESTSTNIVHPLIGRKQDPISKQVYRRKSKSPEVNNSTRGEEIGNSSVQETNQSSYNVNQALERGRPADRCKTLNRSSLTRRPIEQPESINVSIDNEERLSTSELALRQSMAFNQQVSHQTSKSTSCSNEVTNVNKKQNIAISKQKVRFYNLKPFSIMI